MTHYAVSQIVKLIQENLHDPDYYDVGKGSIEARLRQLIYQENPKRYPAVTEHSKYSLDEDFKDKAISTIVQFDRKRIPTKMEQILQDLDLEYLEDKSQWFKLTKLYTILNSEGALPDGMTVRQFWTGAHKMLKSFEPIYIKTVNSYSQYPSTVVLHYKVDYLVDILKHLTNQHFINGNQLISELQSHNIESETK